jgi:hypothetical protein
MDFGNRGPSTTVRNNGTEDATQASQTNGFNDSGKRKPVPPNGIEVTIADESYILSDFINRTDIEPELVSAEEMLAEIYNYYTTNVPNAQIIYHLSTILQPLIGVKSEREPSSTFETPTRRAPTQSITTKFSNLQEEAVVSTYNDQLQRLQIYNPSVMLSRDAYDSHSEIFNTENCQVNFICLSCNKSINNTTSKFRCENCNTRQDPCPICWQKYPAFEGTKKTKKAALKAALWAREYKFDRHSEPRESEIVVTPDLRTPAIPVPSQDVISDETLFIPEPFTTSPQTNHAMLWQSCLSCGHGAHAACLQHIQGDPGIGGQCPTENCLCDCVAGPYRTQLIREAGDTATDGPLVRGDSMTVGDSNAVKKVRALVLEGREGESSEKRVRVVEPPRSP